MPRDFHDAASGRKKCAVGRSESKRGIANHVLDFDSSKRETGGFFAQHSYRQHRRKMAAERAI